VALQGLQKSCPLRVPRKQIGGDGGDGDTPFFCPFAFTQERSYKDSLAQIKIKKWNICANICVDFGKESAKKPSAVSEKTETRPKVIKDQQ
jgi:hypothetical protein